MRGFLQFLVVLLVVFFVVGEFFGGWYLGVPPHTPMFLYKRDQVVTQSRRTTVAEEFALSVTGKVRQGSVTVQGFYEQPNSFQSGATGSPERLVFETTFDEGQKVSVSRVMRQGRGIYKVRIIYEDVTGIFRLTLPPAGTL